MAQSKYQKFTVETISRADIKNAVRAKRRGDHRSVGVSGLHPHAAEYPCEV